MMNTRAEAFAPATIANLGVGFDILGLAVQELGDVVIAESCDEPGVHITRIEGDGGQLTLNPLKNTAGVAANSVLALLKAKSGVRLIIRKNLPLASGLGSSAASAVASALAVNALFGEPLSHLDLLPACLDGEAAVSGRHADNVGPCLLGGITLVTRIHTDQIISLPIPRSLYLTLVTPQIAVPTIMARSVLPATVPLDIMIAQTASVASLVDAIYREDIEAMGRAMEKDYIIEPARAHLMPLLKEMRSIAHESGAYGLVISGAGPTLCAICDGTRVSERVAVAMKAAYDAAAIPCNTLCTSVAPVGAHILSVS
jgi:homoserine kinase